MNFLYATLKSIATVISVYSTLCFIRIILTWIPQLRYSKVSQIFSAICDPYLNLFSRIKFMHFGAMDFSPVLAFSVLAAISSILMQIASTGKFSLAYILVVIIKFTWDIVASVLIILILMTLLRLIFLLAKKDSAYFWTSVDEVIYRLTRPYTKLFWKNKFVSLRTNVILSLIISILYYIIGRFAAYYLCKLCLFIPF